MTIWNKFSTFVVLLWSLIINSRGMPLVGTCRNIVSIYWCTSLKSVRCTCLFPVSRF